jgi:hypothetical protein
MLPMGNTPLPANERQARELARVDPERRAEVWRTATDAHGEKVTAVDVLGVTT